MTSANIRHFEPGMPKQQSSHRAYYQGISSDFSCLSRATKLWWIPPSTLDGATGFFCRMALPQQRVKGFPSGVAAPHFCQVASCSAQSSPICTGESTGRKCCKMEVTFSRPIWYRRQQSWDLRHRSNKQQTCLPLSLTGSLGLAWTYHIICLQLPAHNSLNFTQSELTSIPCIVKICCFYTAALRGNAGLHFCLKCHLTISERPRVAQGLNWTFRR